MLPVHDAEQALFHRVYALAAHRFGRFKADEVAAVPEVGGLGVRVPVLREVAGAAEFLGQVLVFRAVFADAAGRLQQAVVDVGHAGEAAAVERDADDELA